MYNQIQRLGISDNYLLNSEVIIAMFIGLTILAVMVKFVYRKVFKIDEKILYDP